MEAFFIGFFKTYFGAYIFLRGSDILPDIVLSSRTIITNYKEERIFHYCMHGNSNTCNCVLSSPITTTIETICYTSFCFMFAYNVDRVFFFFFLFFFFSLTVLAYRIIKGFIISPYLLFMLLLKKDRIANLNKEIPYLNPIDENSCWSDGDFGIIGIKISFH